jgi:RNA polymerase primary sigma factor
LRQLAQNQEVLERREQVVENAKSTRQPDLAISEMIERIQTATRPTISLDATVNLDSSFTLLQTMSDPDGDRTGEVDSDEAVSTLILALRPREQLVVSLRYGLNGKDRLSLSEVGKVLSISKERVRQLQDRALSKLRTLAQEKNLENHVELSL